MNVEIRSLSGSFGKVKHENLKEVYFEEYLVNVKLFDFSLNIPNGKIEHIIYDKREKDYKESKSLSMKVTPTDRKSFYINDYISHLVKRNLLIVEREKQIEIFNLNSLEYFAIG